MYIGITLIVVGLLGLAFIAYSLTKKEHEPQKTVSDGDEPKKPVDPTPANPIPEPKKVEELDIPQRAVNALKEEGFELVEDVRAVEDLTSINGIGDSYAEDIKESFGED